MRDIVKQTTIRAFDFSEPFFLFSEKLVHDSIMPYSNAQINIFLKAKKHESVSK
jgi:hypothetical protein